MFDTPLTCQTSRGAHACALIRVYSTTVFFISVLFTVLFESLLVKILHLKSVFSKRTLCIFQHVRLAGGTYTPMHWSEHGIYGDQGMMSSFLFLHFARWAHFHRPFHILFDIFILGVIIFESIYCLRGQQKMKRLMDIKKRFQWMMWMKILPEILPPIVWVGVEILSDGMNERKVKKTIWVIKTKASPYVTHSIKD